MDQCRTAKTPARTNQQIKSKRSKQEEGESNEDEISEPKLIDRHQYLQIVGSLLYLATFTRPDISFAVGRAGQLCMEPTQEDYEDAIRIIRYLQGTKEKKLKFSRNGSLELVGFSDSDWGGNLVDRHSTSGYIFTLGGAAIAWASRKQQSVALSATEAEYIASSAAAQEAIYLQNLLNEIGIVQKKPTIIFQDNKGSIAMARNFMTTQRSKHIEIRYHFIRECIEKEMINVEYLSTQDQLADIFTKAIGRNVLDHHIRYVMGDEPFSLMPLH